MAEKTNFKILNQIDVSDHVEKKMNLSYLSWAWAHQELKKFDEESEVIIHTFANVEELVALQQVGAELTPEVIQATELNYKRDKAGAYVKVSVIIKGRIETEYLPVMDFKNKSMVNPTSMDVNKAIKRCFVKALALHGLGLYIYAGEDLPEKEVEKVSNQKITELKNRLEDYAEATGNTNDEDLGKLHHWALGQLGVEDFSDIPKNKVQPFIKRLKQMIDKANSK